jgi:pre-mRNA-splicing factor ATP-dependent RNA helicase DHX38/PRP16
LKQSGVSMEALGMSEELEQLKLLYELPSGDADNDSCVHILVREIKPPFLDGRIVYTTQIDTVPIIKDPTADMAVVAKRGSAVVRKLREQEERTSMRQRFWELGGSTMGNIMGLKSQDKTSQQLEEEKKDATFNENDYKKDSQFAKYFVSQKDSAASSFSKTKTIDEQRKALPICQVRDDFFSLLRDHQVLVVVGQTGSGKTTQLTQYMYEEGYGATGVIGCTQPRRVAAVSVAKRVSEEVKTKLGDKVGYTIRFEDCSSPQTVIQYMTDGILLRESLTDPDLDRYSVIIMDEAHERTLNTDILFGIFKGIVARRRDFRLIVTSATMNAEKFSEFFGNCPIFNIPGRTFPVRTEYSRVPVEDYVDAAVQRCLQIHCSLANESNHDIDGSPSDILIFMTGQEDIEAACYLIAERSAKLGDQLPPLAILPIYSTLASDLQAKIFEKSHLRKVIFFFF